MSNNKVFRGKGGLFIFIFIIAALIGGVFYAATLEAGHDVSAVTVTPIETEVETVVAPTEAPTEPVADDTDEDIEEESAEEIEIYVPAVEETVETEITTEEPASEEVVVLEPQNDNLVRVTNVVDGDTIDVFLNGTTERVRFIGVDTPERNQPGFNEATRFVQNFIDEANGYVELRTGGGNNRDNFRRLRRCVYVNGIQLNAALVEAGHANVVTRFELVK